MKKVLVVGGAGFIGFHVARHYIEQGARVYVADNLWRNGARANWRVLEEAFGKTGRLHFIHADVRRAADMVAGVREATPDLLIHQAAQVAVTTSVADPRLDFEVNALGTFNMLEAAREVCPEAFIVYASTNKVYGGMEDLSITECERRYAFTDFPQGVAESRPLDFHSPYACSKGAADQYVHDYARIYGLRTAVFRQSCIYGTHQYGVEDQGWIAWFVIATVLGRPVTVYGSGKQVRDILWVKDLVEAYDKAWRLDRKGCVYNIGGGEENTLSLLELLDILAELAATPPAVSYGPVRPGDQPVYIANTGKARSELAWQPSVAPVEGVRLLYEWVQRNRDDVARVLGF